MSSSIDGKPQRVIRTRLVESLESARVTRLARAAVNAWRSQGPTGISMAAMLREGLAMRRGQDLTWRQMAMAANAPMLTRATMVDGDTDAGVLPTASAWACWTTCPPERS
ncbi:MAG: hypothetical protein F4110_13260 [Acidimicrobiaceae bacterium]|nr:hypothetical protein [Acidimicrobiaceae bacterium]MYI54927.1 hypothetical protein [Acidimicrobiaceae bacterium]MYK73620.1 hypothetical protein [Acidimicrobiaceae bacterium]